MDNGDGTYNVTFSQTVANPSPGVFDANILMLNSYTHAWEPCKVITGISSTVLKMQGTNLQAGNTQMAIMGTPTVITTAGGFVIVSPIGNI